MRRGFVLLAVLWILVAADAIAIGLTLLCNRATRAAIDRNEIERAAWQADGCAERARAVIGMVLDHRNSDSPHLGYSWTTLDSAVMSLDAGADSECTVALRPEGTTIDVNTADRETLQRLFVALGAMEPQADSIADAILDWRDADDSSRLDGAERAWYHAHDRPGPRNGPFAATAELRRVRGLDSVSGLDSVLGVDPARVLIDRAPLSVLRALPGFGAEAALRVASYRLTVGHVPDLATLVSSLSPPAHDSLLAHYAQVAAMTTNEPDAWILTARSSAGRPPVTSVLELVLRRDGARAAIVRRRSWLE